MGEWPRTITEGAARLRDGSVSSRELVGLALARADAADRQVGALLARFDESALARAEQADRELAAGVDLGPLHGIPLGIKDILAAAEGSTTAQSLPQKPDQWRGRDAVAVERLRAAGAVILGKTTTMEFAIGLPDPSKPFPLPRTPWDIDRWAGGSSSGSGAGVAAGFFLGAVGTDTAGSIRCPAAFCGVSGLMPTYGRVPTGGCIPLSYSLDHIGPLARSAADCGLMLQVMAGHDPRDPSSARARVPDFTAALDEVGLDGVRIGVERSNHFGEHDDPAAAPGFEEAVRTLGSLGAAVTEVEIPYYGETCAAHWVTMLTEALSVHHHRLRERWDDLFLSTRTQLGLGATYSAADYLQAQKVRRVAQRHLGRIFKAVDVVLAPATTAGAPSFEVLFGAGAAELFQTIKTPYWDAVGNPALAVPMGFTAAGLPLSLQLIGRPFEESLIVRVANAYQSVTGWHLRVPPPVREPAVIDSAPIPEPGDHVLDSAPIPEPGDHVLSDSVFDGLLAAAGLTPPPLDRLIMHTMQEGFRPALAAMHAVPEAGDEPPLLIFRPGDE
jgi:aspartyl-tRNA(Asn)/glutamyl-tRNA(Gln) amidotransferase subunit A